MNSTLTAAMVFAALLCAVWIGRRLHRLLPEDHLSANTKETVKLAMGLVATMAALLLGLLVSSAKDSYDSTRKQVIEMTAKITFLNRLLLICGPEAASIRFRLHATLEEGVRQTWGEGKDIPARLAPKTQSGDELYAAILRLTPQDEMQRSVRDQAATLTLELGQSRAMLLAQAVPSVSIPMLVVVVAWLVVIFLGYSVMGPGNSTATLALTASALAVSGAIFLILDLDRPFDGLMRISREPMLRAMSLLAN